MIKSLRLKVQLTESSLWNLCEALDLPAYFKVAVPGKARQRKLKEKSQDLERENRLKQSALSEGLERENPLERN